VDGSTLAEAGSVTSEELGTIRFDAMPNSRELNTTFLPPPKTTDNIPLTTAETRVPKPESAQTGEFVKPAKAGSSVKRTVLISTAVVVALAAIASAIFFFRSKKNHVPIQSIAVMPFLNESGNAEVDYLSDGMTDTLISNLSQLTNLTVKARSSVYRYKGKNTSAQTVGKELNVQAILNGRFGQRGDQLSLTLELVDVQSENVIWSEQYTRSAADLVKLQTDIARDVSSKLNTKLSGADTQKLTRTYTSNPEAYRLYLQGRFYLNKREEKDVKNAIDSYNQAIALDKNYALAYAGLADSYALLSSFGFTAPTESTPRARGYAQKALALDPTLAEPHATLGLVTSQFDYDFVGGEREYKRAIELDPNYATAHQWYGELLTALGRFDEATAEYQKALQLEPAAVPINWDYGRLLYLSGKFDESITQYKKTLGLDPGFARAHRTLAEVYRLRKDYANAIEELARYYEVRGESELASAARSAFAQGGWQAYLQLMVAEDSPFKERRWPKAKAYADLGDLDKAFEQLNAAYDDHESTLIWLKVEPFFESIRSDPRYQELMQKVRFP
jgi:TolB-like protein/Tfp pilus assembly protein PilF